MMISAGEMALCNTFPTFAKPHSQLKNPSTRVPSPSCRPGIVKICKVDGKIMGKDTGIHKNASADQMGRKLAASLAAGIISITVLSGGVSLAMLTSQQGGALFQKACIGCHYEGGNILQPGATLTRGDLERNGVATVENIFNITYYGKGRMPGFGENCTPKGQCTFGPRLSDEDIHLLAEFVKLQADQGWQKLERT
eukprot:Gb_34593 [translate_table: standard]